MSDQAPGGQEAFPEFTAAGDERYLKYAEACLAEALEAVRDNSSSDDMLAGAALGLMALTRYLGGVPVFSLDASEVDEMVTAKPEECLCPPGIAARGGFRSSCPVHGSFPMPGGADPAPAAPSEGWGVLRPGDRRFHYYRDTMSLCRRVGFYRGDLLPDTGKGPEDCAACRKALDREKARA